jgi:YhcH/YjgK/YiaL family protein
MILDQLKNWQLYAACHPAFAKAFSYLVETDFSKIDEGRYEIDGDKVYAMVQDCEGRGVDGARLEAHQKYIDIQFTLSGDELIGWSDVSTVSGEGYNAEKDVEFFTGTCVAWVAVPADHFTVFFPNDAHAPLAADGSFRKVVVKIAVE